MTFLLQQNYLIGVDIGGTKIRAILLRDKEILRNLKIEISSRITKKELIEKIKGLIEIAIGNIKKKRIRGIGIGIPGPVDLKKGRLLFSPNIPDIKDLFLPKIIQKKFGIETVIDNDANCAALGESVLGAGKKFDSLVFINLGTGVGGGIVMKINGLPEVYRGVDGGAGEIGHMVVEKDGYLCSCGNKGCLEAYVSAKGVRRKTKELIGREIDPKELTEMAKRGGLKAIEIYKNIGEYLGIGLANIVNILNPDIIVIGGGIAGAGKFLVMPAKKVMRSYIISPLAKDTQVAISELKENAGAIGAALLLQHET